MIKQQLLPILTAMCLMLSSISYAMSVENNLLSKLDYSQQHLQKIKQLYQQKQLDEALSHLLELYRSKESLYLKLSLKDKKHLTENYSSKVNNSVNVADRIVNKTFLFDHKWDMERTFIPHQFTNEIDWQLNPSGDIEWTYMLNRHRYWQELGRAYLLTSNEKYASTFVKHATDWIEKNPLSKTAKSVVWRRIEAGMRAEYWIKTFEYFKNSKQITPKFFGLFISSLNQHAELLTSSFSNFSKTSNWGVIEFHGLFNLSQFLSEFKEAKSWQKYSLNALETTLDLQVLTDGSHWERSPMYHNAVLSNYMNVILLAKRRNITLPAVFSDKTRNMLTANIKWQKPNFHQPTYGDSDDTDTTDILAFGASLYDDPVMKFRATSDLGYDELFTLGRQRQKSYAALMESPPAFTSSFMSSSGDLYLRDSWHNNASYTSFHLRKLGAGHGHDDLLHFDIYANNRDYLIDSGRYSYVDDDWRKYFKSNQSHNTLGVDDLPNSIYQNSWANDFEARSQGVFTKLSDKFDYAEAENTAYKRLDSPVSIKRRLLYLKTNLWIVFDSFSSKGKHKYSQYFNFPNKNVAIDNGQLKTTYDSDNLVISPINKSLITIEKSWASTDYNEKNQAFRAEISQEKIGFTSFISLLYFPEQTPLTYTKVPVFGRSGNQLKETDVEAIKLVTKDKEYIVMVVHNSPSPAENFFVVQGHILRGEVILLEKNAQGVVTTIIKE